MASLDNPKPQDTIKLIQSRVNDLMSVLNQLKAENVSLREQQAQLISERAALLDKNEQARSRVEAIIDRLKSLENGG